MALLQVQQRTTRQLATLGVSSSSSSTMNNHRRLFQHFQKWLFVCVLVVSSVVADTQQTIPHKQKSSSSSASKEEEDKPHWSTYDDLGANLDPHPDPNDEHYDGMIYVGRWEHTADHHETVVDTATDPNSKRLGFEVDNAVKYIFGTSFDESHKAMEEKDLHPEDHYLWNHDGDVANRSHATKSRAEVLRERRHKGISQQGPKPYGHVETHPLDGGVMPPKVVRVEPFFLDETPVTNEQFGKFVRATYYETEAEQYGWSYVLQSFLGKQYTPQDTTTDIHVDPEATEWVAVEGAYWRRPEGPHSSYKFREHHPVVHVSHRDAAEYCQWKGKRLPGEWEWEAAARAGHWGPSNRTLYTWGDNDTYEVAAKYVNLWGQGEFPHINLAEDGWRGTSPVKHYPSNPMGFYDMTGNVWEWMRGGKMKSRIVRGGSYVDSLDGSVNHAATLGARETIHGTTTAGNIGFRCAKSPKRRTEYHYVWHDEELHGTLAVEDRFGRRDQIPMKGWEDQFEVIHDDEEDDEDDEDDWDSKPKKKKVIKKRERLMTEL